MPQYQGQPTLSDVLNAVKEIHGDVRVALDRTTTHERSITALSSKVDGHDRDIAGAKSQATFFGTLASALVVGFIEGAKALFGPHGGS